LVDRNRITPSIVILFFISCFYFLNLDLIFYFFFIIFILYDLVFSNTIKLNYSFLFFIILCFLLILLNYFGFFLINEFIFLFILSSFFFLSIKKYKNIFFPVSIFSILYLGFNILFIEKNLFFLIILLSFINDTSAFFSGKIIKGPLIIPKISPNKTWSGTTISFFCTFFLLNFLGYNFLFSFFTSISFFLGDIYFSYFKRHQNIKDFSNLLGGHGGILDRFDSIFFPIFLFNFFII